MEVAARVLERYGAHSGTVLVRLVNLRGVDGDVRLPARVVAVPQLVPDGRTGSRLVAPVTGLIVAVDPEKKYDRGQAGPAAPRHPGGSGLASDVVVKGFVDQIGVALARADEP